MQFFTATFHVFNINSGTGELKWPFLLSLSHHHASSLKYGKISKHYGSLVAWNFVVDIHIEFVVADLSLFRL